MKLLSGAAADGDGGTLATTRRPLGQERRLPAARVSDRGEIARLMDTAGNSRNPTRDRLLVLLAFRLALRVSELVDIRRQQIDLDTATIHIRRAKNGTPGIHGLQGDELRLLRALRREHPHADFVFLSERKAPVQKLIERLGVAAELPFTLPGTPWPAAGSIRVCFRPSWAIARSRTRLSTPINTKRCRSADPCALPA